MSGTRTTDEWVGALRSSHERLAALVSGFDEADLTAPSYDTEWTQAQVLSHLGSGAVIFGLVLDAGLDGAEPPGPEQMQPIWAVWNAKDPLSVRDDYLSGKVTFLARLESLTPAQRASFLLPLWGMEIGIDDVVRMRLGEHAVHSWDILVMLDPDATVSADAVDLLIDTLGALATRAGRPSTEAFSVRVVTSSPERTLVVNAGDPVTIVDDDGSAPVDGELRLPAEAFLRLAYGRLDPDHTPPVEESGTRGLSDLRAVFPGF
jgi:uncharacterized protein (TIGR03083 family)